MLIDTHCHLHDREFYSDEDAEAALIDAKERGVEQIICVGTSHSDSLEARDFAKRHQNVYWTYGIHPENASNPYETYDWRTDLPIAIGEVGLDYHYTDFDKKAQIRLFEEMLQLALEADLPLSFHIREAFDDFFPIIANFPSLRGVVHSFSDNKRNLRRILNETSFYIGVNGLATYSTLPTPPLERILLETDAPFLTPEPFRGIINRPGHIRDIADWLSWKLATEKSIIEEETTKNARELFHL